MESSLYSSKVIYYLLLDNGFWILNQFIGKEISIDYIDEICISCSKSISIFRQGYCYRCYFKSPATAEWVFNPEKSLAHLDIEDRDLGFEKKAQLQKHIVYLAYTGVIKVGVTKFSGRYTRWVDQGASSACILAKFPNRYLAGITEVSLKSIIKDKSSWKKMLTGSSNIDLENVFDKMFSYFPEEAKKYINKYFCFENFYYPGDLGNKETLKQLKINSSNSFYKGILQGVKGQYLLFKDGSVFNVRSHSGVRVALDFS